MYKFTVETKSINVTTYHVVHRTLEELLQPRQEDIDYKWYLGPAREMSLHLEFSLLNQKKGGFKLATFGTASQDHFGAGFEVCAKQTFYQKTATIDCASQGPREITQNIPHDGVTQVRNLTMEIACLVWACVLHSLVYKFVDKGITLHGVPPFRIPHMRFVKASLAIECVTSEFDEARAFLLKEVIGGDEGHFRKYLNNVSAAPVSFTNKDDEERAEFLAFSQHVQYFKTKKIGICC